jgi:hypothetical protein
VTKNEMKELVGRVALDLGILMDPQFVRPGRVRIAILRENRAVFVVPPMSYVAACRWLAAFRVGWDQGRAAQIREEFG